MGVRLLVVCLQHTRTVQCRDIRVGCCRVCVCARNAKQDSAEGVGCHSEWSLPVLCQLQASTSDGSQFQAK